MSDVKVFYEPKALICKFQQAPHESKGSMVRELQIFPEQGRIQAGVEQDIGHHVAFVGAEAALSDLGQYLTGPRGGEQAGDIVAVPSDIAEPEAFGKGLAGIEIAAFAEH